MNGCLFVLQYAKHRFFQLSAWRQNGQTGGFVQEGPRGVPGEAKTAGVRAATEREGTVRRGTVGREAFRGVRNLTPGSCAEVTLDFGKRN